MHLKRSDCLRPSAYCSCLLLPIHRDDFVAVHLHLFDEGDAVNLVERRDALEDLLQRRLAQGAQALGLGRAAHFGAGTPLDNHLADVVRHVQKLVDGSTAAVARVVAGIAADAHVEGATAVLRGAEPRLHQLLITRMIRPLADDAEHAGEPLRQHAVERRDKVVGLHAQAEEAADDIDDVVGVDGRKDQVAGERRLDSNLRRLVVADFADHDLVRVVAQDGAQTAGERQTLLLVDGNLRDAVELVLDRVFDGNDLVFFVPYLVEPGVQRRRLTRTSGAGDEHHAIGLGDVAAEVAQNPREEADHVERPAAALLVNLLLVEDTDDAVFAVDGRHDGDAEVYVAPLVADAEASILRDAGLGDVGCRDDLHARGEGRVVGDVDGLDLLVERAVDAVLDVDGRVARLDVNVGGARLGSAVEAVSGQLDDGRHSRVCRQPVEVKLLFALL